MLRPRKVLPVLNKELRDLVRRPGMLPGLILPPLLLAALPGFLCVLLTHDPHTAERMQLECRGKL